MGHQGVDKVYKRIQKRFEWPGLKKACEKWISACLTCQQAKDPRKHRFPLQSMESSGFNEFVQIDHQKVCMTVVDGRCWRLSGGGGGGWGWGVGAWRSHVLRYVIDFRSAMLCIKIGYRV